ncbi:MAG: hypothetical protein AAGG46_01045 [Planctomycetota bacterium]
MATRAPATLEAALRRWSPEGDADRRTSSRQAIPLLIRLTPLDGRDGPPSGPAVTVVGKDLSARGVGIYHERRLPHRYCEMQIEGDPFGALVLRVELTWCRFTRLGWYESGGRVLACEEVEAA